MKNYKIPPIIYFFIIILFWELFYKIRVFDNFLNMGLLYMFSFTIPICFFLTLLVKIFKEKINKFLMWFLTILLTFFYIGQFIFISLFSTPFSFNTMSMADQATNHISIATATIMKHGLEICIMLIPLIFLIIIRKRINYTRFSKKKIIIYIFSFIIFQILALVLLLPGKDKMYSAYKVYYEVDSPNLIVNRFGVITSTIVDVKRILFGFEEIFVIDEIQPGKKEEAPLETKYNVLDIDFNMETKDEIIKQMNTYFANAEVTKQNKYTGIFKNKNLIFIVAEGFNQIAIDKNLTPTLYKLSNEAFVFENFYTPVILSTVGGEMQALLGLVPTLETINVWHTAKPTFPYAIGNSFANIGYVAKAYHNHTYTYYQRDKTRPTIGFADYLGCGNGLQKMMDCSHWPNSDIDMIEGIASSIIGTEEKHVTYILTVSGHANYGWGGNYIARKNKDLVSSLNYSEEVKGYIATHIELDKALELLLKKLSEAGELEDTVIALVGDHYPYNFTIEQINELSTYKRDKVIEVNRSNFILWNPEIPKTVINKVGSQIDVLPTILNLFGIEYDSRIIVGKDILSDTPGLAMFSNRSWVSDFGRYNSGTFIPNEGINIPDDYVEKMQIQVANKFAMSKLLMQKNYYNYLGIK